MGAEPLRSAAAPGFGAAPAPGRGAGLGAFGVAGAAGRGAWASGFGGVGAAGLGAPGRGPAGRAPPGLGTGGLPGRGRGAAGAGLGEPPRADAAGEPKCSRTLRATGGSTAEDAALTNSPWSLSQARIIFEVIFLPEGSSSFASS